MKFQINEGKIDRTFRIIAGGLLLIFGLSMIPNILSVILIIIGLALVITGFTGYCKLYKIIGVNTCTVKKKEIDKINEND